jgi:hypothetical protein
VAGVSTGHDAKVVKEPINDKRIYPPRTGRAEDILACAAPIVQAPPQYRRVSAVFSSKKHPALSLCWSMSFFAKPVPTFARPAQIARLDVAAFAD